MHGILFHGECYLLIGDGRNREQCEIHLDSCLERYSLNGNSKRMYAPVDICTSANRLGEKIYRAPNNSKKSHGKTNTHKTIKQWNANTTEMRTRSSECNKVKNH